MKDNQILEVLEQRGYISFSKEYNRHNIATVYDYTGTEVGRCHVGALTRLKKKMDYLKTWDTYGTRHLAHYLCKEYVEHENYDRCKRIADELDEYANGSVYTCPECGEKFTMPDDVGDVFICPCCHEKNDTDQYEQCGMHEYFDDPLDIEYRCNASKEYKSVQVCVAWGGPNIYIDTASCNVELYWWGDKAYYPISTDAIGAIDSWAEEYWRCL